MTGMGKTGVETVYLNIFKRTFFEVISGCFGNVLKIKFSSFSQSIILFRAWLSISKIAILF